MASRTYNVDAGSNKGTYYINIAQRGTAQTPTGLSSSSVWPVSTGDTIVLYITGADVIYSAVYWRGWTLTSGTLVNGAMTATNNPYTFTFNTGLGTNSSTATNELLALGASALIYWSSSLDSISVTPSISSSTLGQPGATVTDSFTVSGLSTGAKTLITMPRGEIKINSGSWVPVSALAGNGDTVNIRGTAPPFYDGSRIYVLTGENAARNGWEILWEAKTVTNPSAAYGIEVFNSAGNLLLSINSRAARYVNSGSYTVTGLGPNGGTNTTTVTITGMANTDDWVVLATHTQNMLVTLEITKKTGEFDVTLVNTNSSTTVDVTVVWEVLLTG